MTLPGLALLLLAALAALARWRWDPWPTPGTVPVLDLLAVEAPGFYRALEIWWHAAPAAAVLLAGSALLTLWRVWGPGGAWRRTGALPAWPEPPADEPQLVVGEQHHPVEIAPAERPDWLVLPAEGLFGGIAVVGAIGSGKTASCMRPFAQQLFSWGVGAEREIGGLVLEVKGDFCHQVRAILEAAGRGGDYVELSLGGAWSWNPMDAPGMDSYSLAYTIASLQAQLWGRGKEPFWQQAATNLVRWIVELQRLEGGWVSLQEIYRYALDDALLGRRIERLAARLDAERAPRCAVAPEALAGLPAEARAWEWDAEEGGAVSAICHEGRLDLLRAAGVAFEVREGAPGGEGDVARIASIANWYGNDWMALDTKLRTSIKEGLSVFIGLFEDPDVARTFCPPGPGAALPAGAPRRLPPLRELIEQGKVLALNMPPERAALARICGTMLKCAWLQAALGRPADMARPEHAGRWWRPTVFLCDEYQAFATVGENDPSGDEKAFSLTRQARVIPIVATQSLTSLKVATGGGDAWKVLAQALRSKVFLSLSDPDSARQASDICGRIERMRASWSVSESAGRTGVSLGGRLGSSKGSVGVSKSYKAEREALFEPVAFQRLALCQAIVQPFDGRESRPARRVYLKPHFLPRRLPYFEARAQGLL